VAAMKGKRGENVGAVESRPDAKQDTYILRLGQRPVATYCAKRTNYTKEKATPPKCQEREREKGAQKRQGENGAKW
jgi:hypothetical protein